MASLELNQYIYLVLYPYVNFEPQDRHVPVIFFKIFFAHVCNNLVEFNSRVSEHLDGPLVTNKNNASGLYNDCQFSMWAISNNLLVVFTMDLPNKF
jgi:hypothetical protein